MFDILVNLLFYWLV